LGAGGGGGLDRGMGRGRGHPRRAPRQGFQSVLHHQERRKRYWTGNGVSRSTVTSRERGVYFRRRTGNNFFPALPPLRKHKRRRVDTRRIGAAGRSGMKPIRANSSFVLAV